MLVLLLVVAFLFKLGDFAVIPPTEQEDNVKNCIRNIIDVYADDATTVISIYANNTNGNFLPHPMQIPMVNIDGNQRLYNVNDELRKELIIIQMPDLHFGAMAKLGLWSKPHLLTRKFVLLLPTEIKMNDVQRAFLYAWQFDILNVIVLAYDYNCKMINRRSCMPQRRDCTVTFAKVINAWTIPSLKELNSLEVFKLIFKWTTWIMIFLTFIVTSIVWWAVSTGTFASSTLNVYSVTLTGAIHKVPECFSIRCLFLTYVIYAIHLQTGFSCNLVQLLTVPQYSVIKSVEELANSNLPILISRNDVPIIFSGSLDGNKVLEKIRKNVVILPNSKWIEAMRNPQIVENSSIMTSMNNVFMMIKTLERKVHVLVDETFIKNEFITFKTVPGSQTGVDMDKVIGVLIETGLINHKEKVFKRMTKDFHDMYEKREELTENVILTMQHVYPIFLFWGIGLFIATIVFSIEHITHRYYQE
ncbi:hypothetical protein FQA39_LY05558 [Lamprigera yunnana]|nr:hypothetical protein FQA39_LY05558 [Lamprigera yunnana]